MEFEGKCSPDSMPIMHFKNTDKRTVASFDRQMLLRGLMHFKNTDKRNVASFDRQMLLRGLKHDVLNCFIFRTKPVSEKCISIKLSVLLISHVHYRKN